MGLIYSLSNDWKYYYFSLDGINWQAPGYDDSGWNHGPGTLWADINGMNTSVPQERTQMPINPSSTYPYITYYFRTHFNYTNTLTSVTLTFSNYLDDGAAFYLNGTVINADKMPAQPWFNSTLATGNFCSPANAICPYVFSIPGTLLNSGDNVVAVEVHNFQANSADVAFGEALIYSIPPPAPPFITNLVVIPGETSATITWTTRSNSTSQVQYGLTAGLGSSKSLDSTMVTNHSVTLTGLQLLTNY